MKCIKIIVYPCYESESACPSVRHAQKLPNMEYHSIVFIFIESAQSLKCIILLNELLWSTQNHVRIVMVRARRLTFFLFHLFVIRPNFSTVIRSEVGIV